MRYLVTGGAGFIGSHLAERLLAEGHEVLALDDLSTGRYDNVAHLEDHPGFVLRVASVTDADEVNRCVTECQAVFHLASAVGVRLVVEEPVRTIETIVNGTDVVLRACARYRRPVLLTSTSEVYGKGAKVPFAEGDDCVMGPTTTRRWAYACAKALDEFLALAHWHEARLPVVVARLFNTVGPRQTGRYGMVIPRFVAQGLAGEPITVYGDGIADPLLRPCRRCRRGALTGLLGHPEARGQVFNIGNDEEIIDPRPGRARPRPAPAAAARSASSPTAKPTPPASRTCCAACPTSPRSAASSATDPPAASTSILADVFKSSGIREQRTSHEKECGTAGLGCPLSTSSYRWEDAGVGARPGLGSSGRPTDAVGLTSDSGAARRFSEAVTAVAFASRGSSARPSGATSGRAGTPASC